MWHRRVASRPYYIILQHLSDCTASNFGWQVPIPAGGTNKTLDYIGWMGVSLLAITGGGGGGGVVGRIVHAYTRWWNDRLREKNEKRYGFYGREWTFAGITRPIEAGFNKDAN